MTQKYDTVQKESGGKKNDGNQIQFEQILKMSMDERSQHSEAVKHMFETDINCLNAFNDLNRNSGWKELLKVQNENEK